MPPWFSAERKILVINFWCMVMRKVEILANELYMTSDESLFILTRRAFLIESSISFQAKLHKFCCQSVISIARKKHMYLSVSFFLNVN
jgi:hypothetical protein